jgi:hypothetical protein
MTRSAIAGVALLLTVAVWPVHAGRVDKVTDANETAAVLTLKAIGAAQINYRLTCGNNGYAASLAALRAVDAAFGSAPQLEKSGFTFSVTPGAGSKTGAADCKGIATVTKFYVAAVPVSAKTGTKSFAVNENDVIWTLKGLKAPTEPFGPPAQQIKIK